MSENTRINIDHADNPQLQNYFTSKEAGDDYEITIRGKIVSTQGGMTEASIAEIEPDYMDDEDDLIEPDADEPVAIDVIELSPMEEESAEMGMEVLDEDPLMLEDEG